jgi:hypothetical protein
VMVSRLYQAGPQVMRTDSGELGLAYVADGRSEELLRAAHQFVGCAAGSPADRGGGRLDQ